jgi:Cu2+-exporting ATPase
LRGLHFEGRAALNADPRVHSARVNLTLKRASIEAAPEVTADEMIPLVEGLGFEAHELDAGALNATARTRPGAPADAAGGVGLCLDERHALSVSVWSGAEDATRDMFHWISAAIALPGHRLCRAAFLRNAWAALSAGGSTWMCRSRWRSLLALVTSLWETSLSGKHAYFDAALALTFFLLAGRYLDHRTRAMARSAARSWPRSRCRARCGFCRTGRDAGAGGGTGGGRPDPRAPRRAGCRWMARSWRAGPRSTARC